MSTPHTPDSIDDAAAMLSRLTADEVAERLLALEAERRSLAALLRTLRARESVARRRAAGGDR